MHEEEFVRENEEVLRQAASNPAEALEVEDLIEAARVVAEYRLLTEIWWPSPERAMRRLSGGDVSTQDAAEALSEFQTWQEPARKLNAARRELQEMFQIVPRLLWSPSTEIEG